MIGAGRGSDTKLAARVLFLAVAFGTTSFVASITVAPLVGEDLTNSATLSGFPWTAGVLGTGLGSVLLSQLMAKRGRGPGLMLGYLLGGVGAALAVVAMTSGQFALFVFAILLMGGGNSANHLSRYAAADLYPPERRASGLGLVVWAGAIGGVAGPALLDPSGRVAVDADLPRLAGPFLICVLGCAMAVVAIFAMLRARRDALVPYDTQSASTGRPVTELWRAPRAQAALIALAVAQTVMVLIMAMTPVHLRSTGHGLSSVGLVISLHVFGMYGLSPVSGRLTDRLGAIRVVLMGFATLLVAALLAASMPDHAGTLLAIPLFLLGFGWSLSFVAGSALLTEGLTYGDRARLQGATDAVVWTSAAIAGLGSGVLVGMFSYALLCVVGAILIVAPVAIITRRRRTLAVTPA
ncbi:MAG: MFS transporter [Actinomycetota bacterium]